MVYGYLTNQEFISKTDGLLKKLNNKGLWNEDILVIALDKSVRPLAYTLRKLTEEQGKPNPKIKFFGYSSSSYRENTVFKRGETLKKLIDPKKFSKYKKVLILDEHASKGKTLEEMQNILKDYFKESNPELEIHLATLGTIQGHPLNLNNFITEDKEIKNFKAKMDETGIRPKYWNKPFNEEGIYEIKKLEYEQGYKQFLQNRKQLSQDIKDYVRENNLEGENIKSGKLEKAVQLASIISLLGGFIFGYQGITGNVIGSVSPSNIIGVILIIFGILGLVFSQMKRRK
jgi:hypoxanthine phosphoribosyltransferase